MKKVVSLLLLYFTTCVSATECDCSIYPFKPNPPCYRMCVANLSSGKDIDLSNIKNIDPEVSAAITVLSKSTDRNAIKFEKINGEVDLIRAAAKVSDSNVVPTK